MRVSISLFLMAVFLASSASVSGWSGSGSGYVLKQQHHSGGSGGMVKSYIKRDASSGDPNRTGRPKQCSSTQTEKRNATAFKGTPAAGKEASNSSDVAGDIAPAGPAAPAYGAVDSHPGSDDRAVYANGVLSSTHLPSEGTLQPNWFNPSLVYHGPGTTFGGGNNFWQGGACMLDDLAHAGLPSVAMDQTYWQDGLACGTCVEIASTTAAEFSNSAVWKVERPVAGELNKTKKTVAIVSDLCPGVGQCFSGLDMHPDTWNSVTAGANGSKLPINWHFVSCKETFRSTGSGGKSLQVHWRSGANPGFCQVQIRGSYQAIVKVEAKLGNGHWRQAKHVDASFWSFENEGNIINADTTFLFRLTDWQGQTISTEVITTLGRDIFISANFEEAKAL